MKRRETKKGIRWAEEKLARYVQDYLRAHERGDEELKYEAGTFAGSMLGSVLARRLRLGSSWNYRERWVDGLINGHVHVLRPDEIVVHGEMVWGLLRDVGGNQWKEPFSATVRVAKARGKVRSYALRFGGDAALSEKLVETGLYYTLLPRGESPGSGGRACVYSDAGRHYNFCFSKRRRA